MGKYIDAVRNRDGRISDLRRSLLVIGAVSIVGMFLLQRVPHHIAVNVSPSMRAGEVINVKDGVAPVPSPNVYAFGFYVWQQVNRWSTDGRKDYGQQIFAFQHYLTPACQEQLKADMKERSDAGELSTRTRSLNEVPGHTYEDWRVTLQSDDAWTVKLDMELRESMGAMPVKTAVIRYPLRVVRFDVDREKNPFGLAIDCFGANRPERLQAADLAKGDGGKSAATSATPGQPTPTPATLPGPTGQ